MKRCWMPILVVMTVVWTNSTAAQSFFNSQCYLNPKSNPRGLNKELDNSTFESNWELLPWDSSNLGYTFTDTLPFSWSVKGSAYSVFRAVSNGSLTFTTNPLPAVVHLFQTSSLPDPRLAELSLGFFGLIAKGNNDQVFTKVFGAAPHRQYWVKFHSFSVPSDSITGFSVYGTYALVFEENTSAVHLVQMSQGNLTGIPFNNQKRAALTMGANWGAFDGTTIADDDLNNINLNYVPAPLTNGVNDNRFFTLLPTDKYPNWRDAALLHAEIDPITGYIKEGDDFHVRVSFSARGLASPKELALKLAIGNRNPLTFSLDTFTHANEFGVYRASIPVSTVGLSAGNSYNLSLWLENSAGQESLTNNDSLMQFASIIIQQQIITVTGTSCLEVFTGNWDHNSALLDVYLEDLKKSNAVLQNSLILKHHVLDPMATGLADLLPKLSAGEGRGDFPAMTLNRGIFETSPSGVVFGKDSLLARLSKYQVYNTFLVPRVENLLFDSASKTISGAYRISALDYFDPSSVKVTVVLREKTQRGITSGWLQKMSLEETQRSGSVFFGKSTKLVGYTYTDVAFDWDTEGNGLSGKRLSTSKITTPGTDFTGPIKFVLPDSMVSVTFPKTVDFADSGRVAVRYKPADLEVVVLVTDDRWITTDKQAELVSSAPIITSTIQPLWDFAANTMEMKRELKVRVYPNPTDGLVQIQSNQNIQTISVSDITGKIHPVSVDMVSENECRIAMDRLNPGVYLVAIVGRNQQLQTVRVIKTQ